MYSMYLIRYTSTLVELDLIELAIAHMKKLRAPSCAWTVLLGPRLLAIPEPTQAPKWSSEKPIVEFQFV